MNNSILKNEFGRLSMNDAVKNTNNLVKVINAVEAAELIIQHQEEENNKLKVELQKRDYELEHLKVEKPMGRKHRPIDSSDERRQRVDSGHETTSNHDPFVRLILQQTLVPETFFPAEGHSGNRRNNGNSNVLSNGQTAENANFSQITVPTSFSPGRYPKAGDYEPRINVPAHGFTSTEETNNHSNLWNQIRDREEEIIQMRKHLNEFSLKEAQIHDEKCALEKRIAHLRMAFDQRQQDEVDASSKALSYRQSIIEENVRLTYALQDAQQERTAFVSSLLALLDEYSLQPQVSDAQSIVSNVKVLFKHLQEKLVLMETKLKESQYQLTPWQSNAMSPNLLHQSPKHSSDAALTANKFGLELVPQATHSPANLMNSSGQMATDWNSRGQHSLQVSTSSPAQNPELNNVGGFSPFASRDSVVHDAPTHVVSSHVELHMARNRQVKFKEPVSSSEVYAADLEGQRNEREPSSNTSGDPDSSHSPYLQPVPEEPSSFSEAADDDPLPAIEDLQISGEPYPGQQLQACGNSVNGTTGCNFEWVRHFEDGSARYIDGAKQPMYLVTADDVETCLAIEVQPLDDRTRQGELVRVFANDQNKIVCDPAMQSHIEQNLHNGYASYQVSLSMDYLDVWQSATLTIKREGYSIKGSRIKGVAINEKFSAGTTVSIMHGHDMEFSLFSTSGDEHLLRVDDTIPDIASLRDTIVLTLRLFVVKAMRKGKEKKKRIFFK